MAHRLDKHYSDFGGVDTRSNPLTQNPKSARVGSKNFRWNYRDQLQKMEGFQHKTAVGDACEAGLIEYKFRDINTGESRTEILGVSFDGCLRKQRSDYLKLIKTNLSNVLYYNFFYDDVASTHKMQFLDSALLVLGTVSVSLSATLDDLMADINTLALTGLTADIVDEEDVPKSSSLLAYLLDVVYHKQFINGANDVILNPVHYWELVDTPDGNPPFVNAMNLSSDVDYEGISYVNANNSVYITDGGFPFKYDGASVYRAGMPKLLGDGNGGASSVDGFAILPTTVSGGGLIQSTAYLYKFKLGFVDHNGVEILGKNLYGLDGTTGNLQNANSIAIPPIRNDDQFPVYAAKIDGDQTPPSSPATIDVHSGHNIKVGMLLRIPQVNASLGEAGYSFAIGKVTAVTATTIEFTFAGSPSVYPFGGTDWFADNQWLQGGYASSNWEGKITDLVAGATSRLLPQIPFGAFVRVYRTTGGGDTYYRLIDLPLQYEDGTSAPGDKYTFIDDAADSGSGYNLSREEIDDSEGEELPRACKYLAFWQNQLVQAGRPVDPSVADDTYPTIYVDTTINGSWGFGTTQFDLYKYGENHLCDFQSAYWSDSLNPEGFPQSGLNEESFENSFNDSVTSIATNKEALFIHKERTTGYLTGTLSTGDVVKELLETNVGAACQNSVQDVAGGLLFMDPNLGFWHVVAGRLPEFLGYPIQDYFKGNSLQLADAKLKFKKAKSTNFRKQELYICYVPAGRDEDPSTNSLAFVYDYGAAALGRKNCWYVWQGINAGGGILATADDELLISHQETSSNQLWKMKMTGSKYDFSNHISAIEMNYKGAFLTAGAPVIDKNWIRVVISSITGGFDLRVDQYANFIDTLISSFTLTFASSSRKAVKMDAKANQDKLSGISFGFYNNTIHQDVRIDGWEVEFDASFDPGEAKK